MAKINLGDFFKVVNKKVKMQLNDSIQEFINYAPDEVEKIMLENIARGTSPVEGVGKFEKYSDSYTDAIKKGRYAEYGKKVRPVNLTLSGDMLKSIYHKILKNGFKIGFDSPIAKYHNGDGRVDRKFLPNNNEEFAKPIINRMKKLLTEILKRRFK